MSLISKSCQTFLGRAREAVVTTQLSPIQLAHKVGMLVDFTAEEHVPEVAAAVGARDLAVALAPAHRNVARIASIVAILVACGDKFKGKKGLGRGTTILGDADQSC